MASSTKEHLHFLGIAGHAMRGVAMAARELGYAVTGTDVGAKPPGSTWLDTHKFTWWHTSDAKHLEGVDRIVMTGGIPLDDPELTAAQQQNIPIVSYAEFVGELAASKRRIVISGTHGKTTTTSLITWILESAGKHPDFLIGIKPHNFDSSVRLSDSEVIVLEGDEYKASSIDNRSKFEYYRPDVLVATSLEMDHPDMFNNIGEIRERFEKVIAGVPKDGLMLYWRGSEALHQLARSARATVASYGNEGDWHADHISFHVHGISLDAYHDEAYEGHYMVPLYGRHNINNALSAIAVAKNENLPVDQIQAGFVGFKGAARRFQIVSAPVSDVIVVDDYAHHPTEIATTIEAAKLHFDRRVIAVIRPHTYSRTKELLQEHRKAAGRADVAFITDIEGARETGFEATVSGGDIAKNNGQSIYYEPDRTKLVERIVAEAQPGDIVLSMTVSGYDDLAEELATRLKTL